MALVLTPLPATMEPFDYVWYLLKEEDEQFISQSDETLDDAFGGMTTTATGVTPYDEMSERQRKIADLMLNAPPNYWNDPASGEYETEEHAHLFGEGHEAIPDKEYDNYENYLKHYFEAVDKMDLTTFDKYDEHPHDVAEKNIFMKKRLAELLGPDFDFEKKGSSMDLAWRLLKAPLLPETIQHTGTSEDDVDEYTADFRHPVTGEVHPMFGYASPHEGGVTMKPPEHEGNFNEKNMGEVSFSPLTMPEEQFGVDGDMRSPQDWTGSPRVVGAATTVPPRDGEEPPPVTRPVGMGTAMYDLGAHMANKRGVKIVPSNYQSTGAANMWAKHKGKGQWPPPSV